MRSPDDRVLIPGGKHIVLDQSTPMLSELVIHGTLEVAPGGNPKTLNAARILLDNGGTLIAGTSSAPFQGEFSIHFNRGGLAVLGSGALQGSGLLAVADGTLSLVGSKADGQDGTAQTLRCMPPPPPPTPHCMLSISPQSFSRPPALLPCAAGALLRQGQALSSWHWRA